MMTSSRGALASAVLGAAVALACEQPAQGPTEWSYQNGYAQRGAQQTTFQNGYAQQTTAPPVTYTPLAPTATTQTIQPTPPPDSVQTGKGTAAPQQIQTTPVPLGVQTLPAPTGTVAPPTATPSMTMAVPGHGAFVCASDAQCLLGRCNTSYGKCAYPCKHTETDCKAGNVCAASGLCMPRGAAGMSM